MKTNVALTEMWTALAEYQPFADRRGFGAEWERMCTERTSKAADAAEYAVLEASTAALVSVAALAAAGAASEAVEAVEAELVAWWSRHAIADIREAIEMECSN